jgi:hypothetical protein
MCRTHAFDLPVGLATLGRDDAVCPDDISHAPMVTRSLSNSASASASPTGVISCAALTSGRSVAQSLYGPCLAACATMQRRKTSTLRLGSRSGQAYARRVLQDIALEVDGRRAPLALTRVEFPSCREMNEGICAIHLDLTAEADLGAAGEHQFSFRNDHLPELGVYLVNALVPTTSEIKLSGQTRYLLQREMRLSFHVTPADTLGLWLWTGVLILCLCLALLFAQWKHVRQRLRRPER